MGAMNKIATLNAGDGDLDSARTRVETALRVKLAPHESYYMGGDYYRGEHKDFALILQENFLEDDGEPTNREFPMVETLLYVSGEQSAVDSVVRLLVQSGTCTELKSKLWEPKKRESQ